MFIKIWKNTNQEKSKVLIVFDNMIADMINNRKQQKQNCLLQAEN